MSVDRPLRRWLAAVVCTGQMVACGESGDSTEFERVQEFTWQHAWGPCPPATAATCFEQFATADGRVTRQFEGEFEQVTMPASDRAELDAFLVNSGFRTAVADQALCSDPGIVDDVVTVEFRDAEGRFETSKNISACEGAAFAELDAWIERLRGLFETK